MIVIVGLVVLLAAVVVGFTGALTNSGPTHLLNANLSVFGDDITGPTYSARLRRLRRRIPMLGLSVLPAGVRRTAGQRRPTHHELEVSLTPANQSPAPIFIPHSRAMNTENQGAAQ
ncbi:hypothetical protein [Mycolicibacterium nivoides]|uniref:hypothetical protein n=1 Tax=Mycolicibacterium nivoides TaxID=2487344 RepID=UPI0008C9E268|nr:hypothetical protein [Mycolicibacterium nivoides]MBN3508301.1 hypothetical protein [Mycolicibacterium septicum]SER89462.1 hypothetical protein SAMN04488583_0076 [Mycobacterium sp. 88mf]SFF49708.1 hypothetical protein SAMN04488582_1021080 [Mycobacterium sp. 455mf]